MGHVGPACLLACMLVLAAIASSVTAGPLSASEGRDSLSAGALSASEGRDSLSAGALRNNEGRDSLSAGALSASEERDSLSAGALRDNEGRDSLSAGALSASEERDSLSAGALRDNEGRDSLSAGALRDNEGRDSLSAGALRDNEGRDSLTTGPSPAVTCPSVCQCSKGGRSVNCQGKRLTVIPPDIPRLVQVLFLDHNNFVTLTSGALSDLTHLTHVYLRNNQLQTFSAGAFRRLPLLKELYLTNNYIATLLPDAFQEVDTLDLLHLGANKLTSVPDLRSLPGLTKLYMEGNSIRNASFPPSYKGLKNLNTVIMSNNNVSTVTNQTFRSLVNSTVRRLDLARNGLTTVSAGALTPLGSLLSLKIGVNPLNGLQLQNMLRGLSRDSNLVSLDIRDIKLGGTLPSRSFSILSGTPLTTLILKNNEIFTIPSQAFTNLPKLVQLDLQNCKVRQVAEDAFQDLPGLQMLFLSNNPDLSSVPANLPGSLTKLYLQYNSLPKLQAGAFANLNVLQELHLSNNVINEVSEDSFKGLVKLHLLYLQNNKLSDIPKKLFAPLPSLLTLNLKNNNLKSLKPNPGALSALGSLTSLDMSSNGCSYIPYDFFSSLTSLQSLSLQLNALSGLMAHDRAGVLLGGMTKLQTLKPGFKQPGLHPRQAVQLQHLDLKNNRLSSWGPDLFRAAGGSRETLQTVDLSSNQIALVNQTSVRDLQRVKTLNLTLNPFACTCDLRWFSTWLNTTAVDVASQDKMTCNSPPDWNGKRLSEFGPDKIDCTDYLWYYVGAAISVTLLLACVICYVVYHYRWFVWLRFYRMRKAIRLCCCCCRQQKRRRDGYAPIPGQDDPADDLDRKVYDYYVIAAEDDDQWVRQKLLPTLEQPPAADDQDVAQRQVFKLYFEDRDADPRRTRICNYEESMPASRAALVVLTEHLNAEGWCRFLLDQAQQLLADGVLHRIHITKVGKVSGSRVPKSLHKDMERKNFSEWPDKDTVETDYREHLAELLGQGQGQVQGQAPIQGQGQMHGHIQVPAQGQMPIQGHEQNIDYAQQD